MRSHNWHWRWIYLNDDLTQRTFPPMVLTDPRFWTSTFMLDEESPSTVTCRMSAAHVQWTIEYHSTETLTRTWAYKLSGCIAGAICISQRASAEVFNYRVNWSWLCWLASMQKKVEKLWVHEKKTWLNYVKGETRELNII